MSVVISVDAEDFKRLVKSCAVKPIMTISAGRFEGSADGEANTDWDWSAIYWLGRDYTAVIFARAFLAAYGYRYEVLWDTSRPMDQPQRGWCIITDYEEQT